MQSPSTFSAGELAAAVRAVSDYDFHLPRTRLVSLERLINATVGNREARRQIETAMAELLGAKATGSQTTVAAKQFICKKLWFMGTDLSVPALGKLLQGSNPILAEAACYALRSQETPVARATLRQALGHARGVARIAIINLLGEQHDAASSPQLIALATDPDPATAEAAIAALGKIASRDAVTALTTLRRTGNLAGAHALLQAGQQLAKRGDLAAAKAVYGHLTSDTEPSHIRRGATLSLDTLALNTLGVKK